MIIADDSIGLLVVLIKKHRMKSFHKGFAIEFAALTAIVKDGPVYFLGSGFGFLPAAHKEAFLLRIYKKLDIVRIPQ